MYIRFHKGQFVDAVIPTAVGVAPSAAPGDIVWAISADVNPSKSVIEQKPVQATDPMTGAPLVDASGSPVYQTTDVTNPDGTTTKQIVTVPVTVYYKLLDNPTIFTQADIQAVLITPPTVVI